MNYGILFISHHSVSFPCNNKLVTTHLCSAESFTWLGACRSVSCLERRQCPSLKPLLLFLHLVFNPVLASSISSSFFAMSPPHPNEFSGHIRALLAKQPGEKPLQEEIDDDIEGEKETIPNLTEDDLQQPDQNPGPFAAIWRASITSASKGVTEKTDSEYQRSVPYRAHNYSY
jgi:hypothetical protein